MDDLWQRLEIPLEDIPIQGSVAFVPIRGKRRSEGKSLPDGASPAYAEAVRAERRIAKRGRIRGFSSDSRRRLMQFLRRVKWNGRPVLFVTLTFAGCPSPSEAKKQLHRFLGWVQFRYRGVRYVWKMEFQERGAVHFHLILAWPSLKGRVPWLDKDEVASSWGQGFVKIQFVPPRRVVGYLAKYVGKPADGGGDGREEEAAAGVGAGGKLDSICISADGDFDTGEGGKDSRAAGAEPEAGEGGLCGCSDAGFSGGADNSCSGRPFLWPGRFWGKGGGWELGRIIRAGALPRDLFERFREAIRRFLEWLGTLDEVWGGVYVVSLPFSVS